MKVEITVDGSTEEVDVSFSRMRLSELCDIEDQLGAEAFARYQNGHMTPKAMRAGLWAKLRRRFPDLELEDVDMDMFTADDEAVDEGPFDETS